jgi:hypothetical protein
VSSSVAVASPLGGQPRACGGDVPCGGDFDAEAVHPGRLAGGAFEQDGLDWRLGEREVGVAGAALWRGVPVPQIAAKLVIKTGKNAGKHPSVASVYRALADDAATAAEAAA